MEEIRVLSPTSQLGAGFSVASFRRGIELAPHFMACDAGSTDSGPNALGTGQGTFPDGSVKRDLREILRGRDQLGIPLVIGSCGTSGNDAGVDRVQRLLSEVCVEEGLQLRCAIIRSEQRPDDLRAMFEAGRIKPLRGAPEISGATFENLTCAVAMMGPEPIMRALDDGVDVVLAGRASDSAVYASFPLLKGGDPGLSWHVAKIIECGAACVVNRIRADSIFAWIRPDHFEVEPLDPAHVITPQSVASHGLYENDNPFQLLEPGGTLDLTGSRYAASGAGRVRVSGSRFHKAEPYTVKLEGVEARGWQHVIVAGVSDPYILRQLDDWIAGMVARMQTRTAEIFEGAVGPQDYQIHVRRYGLDGVLAASPNTPDPGDLHEVGLIFTVTARDEETSFAIAKSFAHMASHFPIPEWNGSMTGLAFPYSPATINRGQAFGFTLNHVALPGDPFAMFRFETTEI